MGLLKKPDTASELAAWVGLLVLLLALLTLLPWFFVSKYSWIAKKGEYLGRNIYSETSMCLDFAFKYKAVAGSLITKTRARKIEHSTRKKSRTSQLILAKIETPEALRYDKGDQAQITEFRANTSFAIREVTPIFFTLNDMDYLNEKSSRIGTVSFTYYLPNPFSKDTRPKIIANFKALSSTNIERVIFYASEVASEDERCITK
jgi:hypothetical protein